MKNKKGGDLILKRPESLIEARFCLTTRQNDVLGMVLASIEGDDKSSLVFYIIPVLVPI
jgi:plasmid replication initiation protein